MSNNSYSFWNFLLTSSGRSIIFFKKILQISSLFDMGVYMVFGEETSEYSGLKKVRHR
jgi:hypothetical protein